GETRLASDVDVDDFTELRKAMAKRWGPHRLGKFIQCVRCVFKHGFDSGKLDRPVRFGPGFSRPSQKTMRLNRAGRGLMMFEAEEIKRMLKAAPQPLKAMILLGVNCGFGNADCGQLPTSALDLDKSWVIFPRPKTGIERRCPLWPETVQAIRD